MGTTRIVIEVVQTGAQQVQQQLGGIGTAANAAAKNLTTLTTLGQLVFAARVANQLYRYAEGLIEISDQTTILRNRLTLVADSQSDVNDLVTQAYNIAEKTRVSIDLVGDTYSRLSAAIESNGGAQKDALPVTQALLEVYTAVSGSASGARSAVTQLTAAFEQDSLTGRQFRSLVSQYPVLLNALSKSLGLTSAQMRQLGADGQFSGRLLLEAFQGAAPGLDSIFSNQIQPTIEGELTNIRTSFQEFLDKPFDFGNGKITINQGLVQYLESINTLLRERAGLDQDRKDLNITTPGIVDTNGNAVSQKNAGIGSYLEGLLGEGNFKAQSVFNNATLGDRSSIDAAQAAHAARLGIGLSTDSGSAADPTGLSAANQKAAQLHESLLILAGDFSVLGKGSLLEALVDDPNSVDVVLKRYAADLTSGGGIKEPGVPDQAQQTFLTKQKQLFSRDGDKAGASQSDLAAQKEENALFDQKITYASKVKEIYDGTNDTLKAQYSVFNQISDAQYTSLINAARDQALEKETQAVLQSLGGSLDQQRETKLAIYELTDKEKQGEDAITETLAHKLALEQDYVNLKKRNDDGTVAGGLANGVADVAETAANSSKDAENIVTNAYSNMTDAVVAFAQTGKLSFTGLVDGMLADVTRLLTNQLFSQILGGIGSAFGGTAGGSGGLADFLVNAATPKRASGGPVTSGQTYLVGERGPELFHAGASGTIVPNSALGGPAAPVVHVHNIIVSDPDEITKALASVKGQDAVVNAVRKNKGAIKPILQG